MNNLNRNTVLGYIILSLFVGLYSCKDTDENVFFNGDEYENIMQYIDANEEYSSFASIVHTASMSDMLSSYNHHVGGNDYTLFLPNNKAVAAFFEDNEYYASLDELLADTLYAKEIVRFHMVNAATSSNEFPNGALADKTISNFYLTIVFREADGSISYSVNDDSKVLITDINKSNGVVHTIDKMLTPVVYTTYEWVEVTDGYSIFSELLESTGLKDTLIFSEPDELGRDIYNEYTTFVESDALYAENGITSFQDLVDAISPGDNNYSDQSNAVNQYARYHILEQSLFLDEIETELEGLSSNSTLYNTYGELPIAVKYGEIAVGEDDTKILLMFNIGVEVYDTTFYQGDTLLVNFLTVDLTNSNVVTRSGAIHQLNHLLSPFRPGLEKQIIEFYEESEINALKSTAGSHPILDEDLLYTSLVGTDRITYYNSATDIEGCFNNDYLRLYGDVDFTYTTPRILAGRYRLILHMQRGYSSFASFQASVDDEKIGVVKDLSKESVRFMDFSMGTVNFTGFESHELKISTVVPGYMYIDRVIFDPIN